MSDELDFDTIDDVRHIYDWSDHGLDDATLSHLKSFSKVWLESDRDELDDLDEDNCSDAIPDGWGKSHQMVLGRTSYGNYRYKFPHCDCVGGIEYDSSKHLKWVGGLFFPSFKYNSGVNKEKYRMYLDWAVSCGPQSSLFIENSVEEWETNHNVLSFHGNLPGNVVGMSIISMRMWQYPDVLEDWYWYVTEKGIHPWVALWLTFNSKPNKKKNLIARSNRGDDGHSTFSPSTNLNKYKKGIVNIPSTLFKEFANASYNGSHIIWNSPKIGENESDIIDNYLKKDESKEQSNETLDIFLKIMENPKFSKKGGYDYSLSDENVAILNSGLCPRIVERTKPWLAKWSIKEKGMDYAEAS